MHHISDPSHNNSKIKRAWSGAILGWETSEKFLRHVSEDKICWKDYCWYSDDSYQLVVDISTNGCDPVNNLVARWSVLHKCYYIPVKGRAVFPNSTMASRVKALIQTLRRYVKKPWEITGPTAHPEYRSAVPKATEYRVFCPATIPSQAIVPTSLAETVYDIKYFSRDQRRNRPPIKRTILKKADVETMMKEKTFDPTNDFPQPYLTATIVEDDNAIGGGYQK